MKRSLFIVFVLLFFTRFLQAQISSPTADGSDVTNYPVFPETDDIFIFCTNDSLAQNGTLLASTDLEGTKTFVWDKYNENNASFELFFQESTDDKTSQISGLADGCYRISISQGATTVVDRAWVFSNWYYADGAVTQSNCDYFVMQAEFSSAVLTYYDLSNNTPIEVIKDVQTEWLESGTRVSSLLYLQVYDPPTQNTNYSFRIYDKFDCEAQTTVLYESIVTKAKFTADPMDGEAPMEVVFSNNSENGTQGYYEWFFYRDLDEIKEEGEGGTDPVDSIDFVAYDDAPVYTYENSGTYMVKLVSKHLSDTLTCVDTAYLEDYIVVDTSWIVAPNVFTPGVSPGQNDEFVIKFWSMKNIEINVYNRWGKRVHYWKSGDIRGWDTVKTAAVWDGKVGGRYASPGVYYYVAVGRGRDGKKRTKHGFVHLFRDK